MHKKKEKMVKTAQIVTMMLSMKQIVKIALVKMMRPFVTESKHWNRGIE